MSNSPLVSLTRISPNKNSPRNHKIDTITIHCYVGQASVESMAGWLCNPEAKASSNYGIGSDGRIALFVDENDRSWCSSNSANDNRAITIECASDKQHPYAINDKVYKSLIELCADICERNDIKELKWKGDKTLIGQVDKQNMTVHRWFKNKDCPGEYIYSRLGKIAEEVNAKINGVNPVKPETETPKLPKTPFKVDVIIDDLNYRSLPDMDASVEGQTGRGIFTIIEEYEGWGKLKSCAGWIWLRNPNYCTIHEMKENVPNTFVPYLVKVSIDNLNIRTGPNKNFTSRGLTGIGVFEIIEEQAGPGSSKGWGKLKSGAGWISLDFATRI